MVQSLVISLALIITLIVEFIARNTNELIDVETTREHSEDIDEHLKVV